MTKEEESALRLFETRVRQLILKYQELEKENQELYSMVDEKEQALKAANAENAKLKEEYEDLKLAKMIDISSQELGNAKSKVAKMIRDIDTCIALLNF